MTRRFLTLLLLATSLFAAPAFAQAPAASQGGEPVVIRQTELDRQVKRVASQIRCVVCRGQSIQDSPSELAQEMRAVVREQLMAGKTEDEVKAFFIESYGQQVLLKPEARGFNLLIYVLPVLVFLGGAVFVFLKARSLAAASKAPAEVEG
jgi:cytochrome c-type biogenesis protein CcmH